MPAKSTARSSKPKSLIISAVIGVLLFALLIPLIEGLFRWTHLDTSLQLRSLGLYHNQFEIKWFTLKDYVQENGGVDVIILGNSMVNTGIDPDILTQRYAYRTGIELRVFNFGVEGLTVAPNSVLARILVQEYRPSALIFLTEMRDYTATNGVEVEQVLLNDEWFVARTGGKKTLTVWLKENSSLVQHVLPLRNWSRDDFMDTHLSSVRRFANTTESGYEADYFPFGAAWLPPDPENPAEQQLFEMFSNYTMDPGRLANLADMLSLTSGGTQVWITELPLHPNYFTYFRDDSARTAYLEKLVPFITIRGGVFLPPLESDLIPESFRSDYYHLNYKGAMIYSALLADQLAEMCLNEDICLQPVSSGESAQ
mgnify:CR=1 FL=1